MPSDKWKPRSRAERRYETSLKQLSRQMVDNIRNLSTLADIVNALKEMTTQPWFRQIAAQEARSMVKMVVVENAQTWRQAARKGQRAREIFKVLRSEVDGSGKFAGIVSENSKLIRTLPDTLAKSISQKAATEAMAGRRNAEIVSEILREAPDLAQYQAVRTARTEVAKAHSTVTQIRSEELGIDWYVWETSQDQRVRSSHDIMQGVVCAYSHPPSPERLLGQKKPPAPYHPGNIYNCRCYAAPVVDVDELTFPVKVYWNGQIQRMSKKQFLALNGQSQTA